ncbi:hypothetical protein BDZ89DRAFT_1044225 [Hymenopellis radicata]|nr:hypothetical protein BDZ89DRAFT_1044225 [Hymenopellis radicata]
MGEQHIASTWRVRPSSKYLVVDIDGTKADPFAYKLCYAVPVKSNSTSRSFHAAGPGKAFITDSGAIRARRRGLYELEAEDDVVVVKDIYVLNARNRLDAKTACLLGPRLSLSVDETRPGHCRGALSATNRSGYGPPTKLPFPFPPSVRAVALVQSTTLLPYAANSNVTATTFTQFALPYVIFRTVTEFPAGALQSAGPACCGKGAYYHLEAPVSLLDSRVLPSEHRRTGRDICTIERCSIRVTLAAGAGARPDDLLLLCLGITESQPALSSYSIKENHYPFNRKVSLPPLATYCGPPMSIALEQNIGTALTSAYANDMEEEKCRLLEAEKGALQGQNNPSADAVSALTKERGALALNVACGEEVKRVMNVQLEGLEKKGRWLRWCGNRVGSADAAE